MRRSRLPQGGANVFQKIRQKRADALEGGLSLLDLSIGEPKGAAFLSARQAAQAAVMSDDEAIHAQENREAAQSKAADVVTKLKAMKLKKVAELVEQSIDETLSFYAYPPQHWIKLKTNNPLERIMREIRRRTRVVGAFPDGQSALNLAAARLRHIAGTKWSLKRYMNMNLLKQQRMTA